MSAVGNDFGTDVTVKIRNLVHLGVAGVDTHPSVVPKVWKSVITSSLPDFCQTEFGGKQPNITKPITFTRRNP